MRLSDADTPLLELDSSASGIVLNQKDAERAGVHPLTTKPSSPDAPYVAVADRVKIGNLEYHDCPVHVVPADALGGGPSLIGTDFFRDHLIHIDYVAKLLSLDRPGPSGRRALGSWSSHQALYRPGGEREWSPVLVLGSNLLMASLINKKGPFYFVIDTGTVRTILSPAVQSAVLGSNKETTLNLRGVSGTR